MNLYSAISVFFVIAVKVGVNELNIVPFDLVMFTNLLPLPVSLVIVLLSKDHSFKIPFK